MSSRQAYPAMRLPDGAKCGGCDMPYRSTSREASVHATPAYAHRLKMVLISGQRVWLCDKCRKLNRRFGKLPE